MLALLNATGFILAHAGDIPHVHPHAAGVALGAGLVLAFVVGGVAILKRKTVVS